MPASWVIAGEVDRRGSRRRAPSRAAPAARANGVSSSDSSPRASRSKATKRGRGLLGQQVDPRLRRGGCAAAAPRSRSRSPPGDDDLAVDDALLGQVRLDRLDDLGEVAGQRPLVAAAELDLVAVAEDDAAEAVPLGLVETSSPAGGSVAALASIGFTGGITGRSMRVSQAGMRRSGAWATIYTGTTMAPTKLELLADWLPRQPWYRRHRAAAPALSRAGGFRLDDPAGEVGIEFMLVADGEDDDVLRADDLPRRTAGRCGTRR